MHNYLFIFYFGSKDDLKCAHVFILTNLKIALVFSMFMKRNLLAMN